MDRGTFGSSYSQQNGSSNTSSGSSTDFTRLTDTISSNTQKIAQNVARLRSYLALYGTNQDNPELHDKVQQLQQQTNQLAKDTNECTNSLRKITFPPSNDGREMKLLKERLVDQFVKVLTTFQELQREEKEKEKKSVMKARSSFGESSSVSYDPFSENYNDPFQTSFAGTKQASLQIDHSQVELEMVREREEAIRKLEGDIMDVNQIFKDLGALVHEQGEVIDSIEANVESASISVEQGGEQLRQANVYKAKSRKKKCILLIVVLVILAIIGLIIGLSLKDKNK